MKTGQNSREDAEGLNEKKKKKPKRKAGNMYTSVRGKEDCL
jgi:hypothetical protein